jgi:hypothetical protein
VRVRFESVLVSVPEARVALDIKALSVSCCTSTRASRGLGSTSSSSSSTLGGGGMR